MLELEHEGKSWIYELQVGNEARQTLALDLTDNRNLQLSGELRMTALAWFNASDEERAATDFSVLDAALTRGLADPERSPSILRQIW